MNNQKLTPEELKQKFKDLIYLYETSLQKLDTDVDDNIKKIYRTIAREAGEELLKLSNGEK